MDLRAIQQLNHHLVLMINNNQEHFQNFLNEFPLVTLRKQRHQDDWIMLVRLFAELFLKELEEIDLGLGEESWNL